MSEWKPLTLEELRKMDGKPVFVECLNPQKYICPPVGWRILSKSITGRFGVWDGENCLVERDYGTDWIAYSYEPPFVDRSAWEPCEFCGKADFGEFGFEISKHYAKIVCALGSWRFPKNERFNFCPKCGCPLTDSAWDMLERRLAGHEHQ